MKYIYDTIIVGGGKFGSVIARALQSKGQSILVFDDRRPMNGSAPSGGLMKPSWINMMDKKDINQGLELLNNLYGVDDIKLNMFGSKLAQVTAHHIPVSKILRDQRLPVVEQKVTKVSPGEVKTELGEFSCKNVVVAGGIWTNDLLPDFAKIPGLYGKRGMSFVFPGTIEAFIRPWSPYKQIVAHAHEEGSFWAGDGTALLPESWTAEKQLKIQNRVCGAVKRELSEATLQYGTRPFVDGVTNKQPCYLKFHDKARIIVVAGGGKNGMIASAWAANRILEKLC